MLSDQLITLPAGDFIADMRQDDLDAVYQLECSSQKEPWSLRHFADELENPVASVDLYWCQGALAGFLCSWLISGELQIQNLATMPAMRRRGVAAKLLEHAIERGRATSLMTVWLEVRASNIPAITLYQRFGFSVCGRRAKYYPDGEDALVMNWTLSR